MWLAENWDSGVPRWVTNESHPKRIREAYREWLAEEWDSIIHAVDNGESHPTVIRSGTKGVMETGRGSLACW